MAQIAKHMIIKGIVQGVGMRFFISKTAKHYALKGYVKNLSDGTVECLAIGRQESVATLEREIRTNAPGTVDDLTTKPITVSETFESFRVKF